MPEISIICPVYNVERFLARCLDSVLAQTFEDWELILIDDGSPDSSGSIADSYAAKDARIKVIHKKNGGVSAARQTGLDAATGNYLIHVDPDDWVEPGMLQALHDKALEEHADVVICDYYVTDTRGQSHYVVQKPTALDAEAVLRDLFRRLHGSCCNKMVRRACLMEHDIRFPVGLNHCEDLMTWVQLFQHEEMSVAYVPEAYYHYVQRDQGITRAYTRSTYAMRLRYLTLLEECLSGGRYNREIQKARLGVFTEAFIYGVLSRREAWVLCWRNRRAAFCETRSLRWLIIYTCILFGCFYIAKKLAC